MMRNLTLAARLLVCAVLLSSCPRPPVAPTTVAPAAAGGEHFCLREGSGHNCILRDANVAAHVLATSGERGRLVVAFPAENSGVALWAKPEGADKLELLLEEPIQSFTEGDLRGVRVELTSNAPLAIEKLLSGSIRVIRDYDYFRSMDFFSRVLDEYARVVRGLPSELQAKLRSQGVSPEVLADRSRVKIDLRQRKPALIEVSSTSLDGAHRFRLRLRAAAGEVGAGAAGLTLRGPRPLQLTVEAASSYPPLAGLELEELLRPAALRHLERLRARPEMAQRYQQLASALRSLSFLATRRKLLAGSWRFLTYFGRDTLMSVWLLQPALAPAGTEAGLQAVLDRLSPSGEVAHEESLGDQAVLERLAAFSRAAQAGRTAALAQGIPRPSAPVYDYKMVDDDFMLLPVLAAYLEDPEVSAERARRFLGARSESGRTNLEAVASNLEFVLARSAPYAASGQVSDLISLKPGVDEGDWRDSNEGLGHGRYPASVNAYLVPVALEAAQRLLANAKLDRAALLAAARAAGHRELQTADLPGRLTELAAKWDTARSHYAIRLGAEEIRARLRSFLQRAPMSEEERSLLRQADLGGGVTLAQVVDGGSPPPLPRVGLAFDALSLNADGRPVEVMHTDDGFALFGGSLPTLEVGQRLAKYEARYPLGLRDAFGDYVANPALTDRASDYTTFDRGHYHGTVVWSWQLLLLERGLMRQLERCRKLAARSASELERRIGELLGGLRAAEERVGGLRSSELWTVRVAGGRFEPIAYGHASGHTAESNALQLWSDLNLAVDLERTRLGLVPAP